jgi:uncharacterized RDD family membrane protein YckC
MSLDSDVPVSSSLRYARFSRRLRGIVLDWVIALLAIFGAIGIAITIGDDTFSRALGIVVVIALLLYEPVLVSFAGGTLGHYFTNLRVVDDRDGGNVSFLKACLRALIKGLLGWYSFVILAATRRNQAVHDLLTRSTVQIRDPAKASPGQYITERSELAAADLPSRVRRAVVICMYLLLMFAGYVIILGSVIAAGIVSARCTNNVYYCSTGERITSLASPLVFLAMAALVIAFGWKGRLFGARRG